MYNMLEQGRRQRVGLQTTPPPPPTTLCSIEKKREGERREGKWMVRKKERLEEG
jgi:hypothetical protein